MDLLNIMVGALGIVLTIHGVLTFRKPRRNVSR